VTGSGDVEKYLREVAGLLQEVARSMSAETAEVAAVVAQRLRDGGKVLLCGNGGSAALAQHVACELVGRLQGDHPPWPAIALTSDSSVVTAVSNDFGFGAAFSRQVDALGAAGDVLIAVSTSGESPNVLAAARTATQRGMIVVGLTGHGGGSLADACDHLLAVPSAHTPQIQEAQNALAHAMCIIVEQQLERHEG
jgi:D-sedoheptulose 7-phosphate isomerase